MGLKDFQVISKLGEGAFSSVYKVKRISDGQEYAMKKVKLASLSPKEKQNALNEVRILASIKNPYIVGYKEAFLEDNTMTLCIVMELAAGGDLYNKIIQHQKARTHFKEEDVWRYAIQMVLGLKTLHDMRILHRDLKCANTFLSKDGKEIKLGDLNVSKVAKTNLVYTQAGTPYYASPEVWRDQPYDMKSDIWSLGCVLYEICALKPPFRANDMQGLNRKIQKGIFERIPSQYSADLQSFVAMCLQVTPSNRPTCDKILSHPLVLKRGNDLIGGMDQFDEANELLGTIQLPRNIRAIGAKLPKANYAIEIRSEEFEKGSLNKIDESDERVQNKPRQRAYSHQLQIDERANKPASKQVRLPSGQRVVVHEVAKKDVNDGKMPIISPQPPKKVYTPVAVVRRRVVSGNPESRIIRPLNKDLNKENENVNPIKRPERQGVRHNIRIPSRERINSHQAAVLNRYNKLELEDKYLNRRAAEKIHAERDDAISRRAENLVRKYYADAANVEKREPLSEIRGLNNRYNNPTKGDAIDILERYNNIYNAREANVRPLKIVNIGKNDQK